MILCHRYKFIFLKTNKTAGTSVEIALSKFCGEGDIVTPLSQDDEATRRRLGHGESRNYLAPAGEYGLRDVARLLIKGRRKRRFYNHITAGEVMRMIPREIWDGYYKFCFERNPWDRVMSLYYARYRSEPRPSVAEFLASETVLELKKRGIGVYTVDGRVVVDKICRYENLAEELAAVGKALGLPEALQLVRAKSGYRRDAGRYADILSAEEKAEIGRLFRPEIDLFGYSC